MWMSFFKTVIGAFMIVTGLLGCFGLGVDISTGYELALFCLFCSGLFIYVNGLAGAIEKNTKRAMIEMLITLGAVILFFTIGAVLTLLTILGEMNFV